MTQPTRPKLFRYRHFEAEIILLCVRWYLRYSLSYRELVEMMAERGLSVDYTTIYRWVQHCGFATTRQSLRSAAGPNSN